MPPFEESFAVLHRKGGIRVCALCGVGPACPAGRLPAAALEALLSVYALRIFGVLCELWVSYTFEARGWNPPPTVPVIKMPYTEGLGVSTCLKSDLTLGSACLSLPAWRSEVDRVDSR